MRSRPWYTLVLWMTVFAVAMAWLESAVVLYLRALYYPNGFSFPLVTMDADLVVTEFGRELATLVMLFAPGALVSNRRMERFAWFLLLFGVWDIFYYVWLKVLLDWPASLNDPDILFLVPVPWIGPVWAPCLVSVGLIALAIVILHRRHRCSSFRFKALDLALLIGGAAAILVSFIIGPLRFALAQERSGFTLGNTDGSGHLDLGRFMPDSFDPAWFCVGAVLAAVGILIMAVRK